MILDHPLIAVVQVVLTILSALGGIGMIFKISKYVFSKALNFSPTVVIMNNNRKIKNMRIKKRRENIQKSDTESDIDTETDSDDYESDIEIQLKKRIFSEAPPPYSS